MSKILLPDSDKVLLLNHHCIHYSIEIDRFNMFSINEGWCGTVGNRSFVSSNPIKGSSICP